MKHESNRTVSSSLGDGEIPVFTTADGDGARPGLLLIPAIFGVDEGAKTLARDVATLGAHVWAPDTFWRTSPGVVGRDDEGFKAGVARAREVEDDVASADFADIIAAMGDEEGCNGNVAIAGLCFAGKFALLLTSQGHAAAGVSFHGTGMNGYAELVETITAPLSLHFGDADIATPVEAVASLRESFEGHENVKIFLHEGGVEHGFADPGAAEFDPDVYKIGLAEIGRLLDGLR
jgi:carboxymethylenebutenolidase